MLNSYLRGWKNLNKKHKRKKKRKKKKKVQFTYQGFNNNNKKTKMENNLAKAYIAIYVLKLFRNKKNRMGI